MQVTTYSQKTLVHVMTGWLRVAALFIIFFLITTNRIFPFPVDKVVLPFFVLLKAVLDVKQVRITKEELWICSCFLICCFFSVVCNLFSFASSVFFPLQGLLLTFIISKRYDYLKILQQAIFLHILLGIFLWIASYVSGLNPYVISLASKGLPFVNGAMGFTATGQTYGTLCICWLILYFIKKEKCENQLRDKLCYFIVTLAVFITFNRATYLAYLMILFFKDRKLLSVYITIVVLLTIYFFDHINSLLLNKSTLSSRSELLEGFDKSFWKTGSVLVWLFGRGNNMVSKDIIQYVTWDDRFDIENGHAMLLHTYGFLGYLVYLGAVLIFTIRDFLRRKMVYEFSIAFYYLIVEQYFTQEFVSTTFYITLGIFIFQANRHREWQVLNRSVVV